MLVMVSNATGIEVGLLYAKYPGRLGHLFSPGGQRGPWAELPHAGDNDGWPAYLNDRPWDEAGWRELVQWEERVATALFGIPPLWMLVPDVVADRDGTLRMWDQHEHVIREAGFRQAFAVQNGMTFADVPTDDCMLFLGGDDDWKDAAIAPWCAQFPGRVHVGRVNYWGRLMASWNAGAVSVDGTNWFRKGRSIGSSQANDLRKFLRETDGMEQPSPGPVTAPAPHHQQELWET